MLIYFFLLFASCYGLPERGIWELNLSQIKDESPIFAKSMFRKSFVDLSVRCESSKSFNGTLTFSSITLPCLNKNVKGMVMVRSDEQHFESSVNFQCQNKTLKNVLHLVVEKKNNHLFFNSSGGRHFLETSQDGIYSFKAVLKSSRDANITLVVKLASSYGYLSAMEWPLLVFYSLMCAFYSLLAIVWLVLVCRNWNDLLRLQIWIGAVIFLGMLEKALFVSEYEQVNRTGRPLNYPVLAAEVVSCLKRTLARVLIMIVCIGYGIVKPRLGPAMKKILAVGAVYLGAALVECFMRVLHAGMARGDNYLLVPNLVLVVTDSLIMWWSFSYLIQTIKDMRQRRNVVKFNLYRHFSNILIIVVVASVLFMAWFLYTFKSSKCVKSWNEVWVNTAFWHVLFSVVLTTIMVLWRPSKNSQRYAYSPLLDIDNGDLDDGDDLEDGGETVTMDNLTTGELRKPNQDGKERRDKGERKTAAEDDLRWIEENIPASAAERIYPVADSDEETPVTKATAGKMD